MLDDHQFCAACCSAPLGPLHAAFVVVALLFAALHRANDERGSR